MTNQFAVDTARIASASGDIERISATIESEVRAMMTRLHGLQDCWRGSAAGGFQAVVQEWQATQEQVRTALESISTTLRTAGADYEAVEQANLARFTVS